jgi:hypothetical protein
MTYAHLAEIVLSAALAVLVGRYLIDRRKRIPISWLTVRGDRVGLTDKARAKIERRGLDVYTVEKSLNETMHVDADGDIASGGSRSAES